MADDYNEFKFLSLDRTFSADNENNETLLPQQWPILAFFLVLISQTLILVNRGNKHTHFFKLDRKYTFLFVAETESLPSSPRFKLEDDQLCGITTGGKENCEWDCISGTYGVGDIQLESYLYGNIECLRDCFSEEDHCAVKVLNDLENSGGICGESFVASQQNILPTTEKECKYIEVINEQNITILYTTEGIFSEDTLESLNSDKCIFDVHRKSQLITNTIIFLVISSSDIKTLEFWMTFQLRQILGLSDEDIDSIYGDIDSNMETKLHPGFR